MARTLTLDDSVGLCDAGTEVATRARGRTQSRPAGTDILNDPEARVAEGCSFSLGDVPVLDEIDFVRNVKLQGLRQRGTR